MVVLGFLLVSRLCNFGAAAGSSSSFFYEEKYASLGCCISVIEFVLGNSATEPLQREYGSVSLAVG